MKRRLNQSVFLDGDWCWDAHPFLVNLGTKEMVMDNICHILNKFIYCRAYEHIVLDTEDCQVRAISLVFSRKALAEQLRRDIRRGVC